MSLLSADSRDGLVTPLAFLRRTSEVIERLKVTVVPSPTTEEEPVAIVTFVKPDQTPVAEAIEIEPTPSAEYEHNVRHY